MIAGRSNRQLIFIGKDIGCIAFLESNQGINGNMTGSFNLANNHASPVLGAGFKRKTLAGSDRFELFLNKTAFRLVFTSADACKGKYSKAY
jgi:hypothetical protein